MTMPPDTRPLIEVKNLQIAFPLEDRTVTVVNDISLTIPRGKTLGLVGESGCGKSMTGLSLLQLIPSPGRIVGGEILYTPSDRTAPVNIAALPPRGDAIRAIRGAQIAMIFQ